MQRALRATSAAFLLLVSLAGYLPAQTASTIPSPPTGPFGSGGVQYAAPAGPAAPGDAHTLMESRRDCAGDACCDTWRWDCGASVFLLRPYFQTNPAYTSISGTANQGNVPDFSWPISASPAVWLGVTAPGGVGFRARYFRFDQESDVTRPDDSANFIYPSVDTSYYFGNGNGFNAPGVLSSNTIGQDNITVASTLEIDVFDAEATYQFHPGDWTLLASLGLRYLHMHQDYSITLSNQATVGNSPVSEFQQETYGHNFFGLGPTVALDAKCPLGCNGLFLYGNVRGSLLVGTQHEYLAWAQQVNDPGNVAGGSFSANAAIPFSHNQVFPVAEAEIGLEYMIKSGSLMSIFRAGLVTLNYFDAGNASYDDGNLNLFGVQFTAAFCF
jgi:hypothetical protein